MEELMTWFAKDLKMWCSQHKRRVIGNKDLLVKKVYRAKHYADSNSDVGDSDADLEEANSDTTINVDTCHRIQHSSSDSDADLEEANSDTTINVDTCHRIQHSSSDSDADLEEANSDTTINVDTCHRIQHSSNTG